MPDGSLDQKRLSRVRSLGNHPMREVGHGAEWRASSTRVAAAAATAVAAAGSESPKKRSDEQLSDENEDDDDDEERVRIPIASAGGYERWQWGRILGNYHTFLFFIALSIPLARLVAFSVLFRGPWTLHGTALLLWTTFLFIMYFIVLNCTYIYIKNHAFALRQVKYYFWCVCLFKKNLTVYLCSRQFSGFMSWHFVSDCFRSMINF